MSLAAIVRSLSLALCAATMAASATAQSVQLASDADPEGGTGLDFVSAADPQVGGTPLGTTADGSLDRYGIAKYPTAEAPIVVASGLEARLIEAEAVLDAAPESGAWLAILNTLRTEAVGGVVYGTATSIPFPAAQGAPFNPAVTGCTSR